MPLGLVAGTAGAVVRTRATQLFNAIPQAERANWRIFYFDQAGNPVEYTTSTFNNPTVNIATQTNCVIFCHGSYSNTNGVYRSTGLSRWDTGATTGTFDTAAYTGWLRNTATAVATVIVAACHAGDVVAGRPNSPIQDIVAV